MEAGLTGGDKAESYYYVLKAENQLYFKQYKDAYKLIKKALKLDENNREALVLAGDILQAQGKSSKALQYYNRAKDLGLENPNLLYKIALTNMQYGNYPEAIESLGRAIALDPENPELYESRANAKYEMKLFSEAINDYNKVLEFTPSNAKALARKGFSYTQLGNYQQALEFLNRSITINPESGEALYQRGITYIKAYNKGKGCDDLRTAKQKGYEQAAAAIKENCD